jgi:hypothetical protein
MLGAYLAQIRQGALAPQKLPQRMELHLAPQLSRQQGDQGHECRAHPRQATPHPANRPRQLDVRAQGGCRLLDADARSLDPQDHLLGFVQAA